MGRLDISIFGVVLVSLCTLGALEGAPFVIFRFLSAFISPFIPPTPLTLSMSRLLSDFCYFDFSVPFPTLSNMKGLVPDSISISSIITCRPSPGLTSLPDDVLLLVISLIGVEDILALRMVCAHNFDSAPSAPDL